MSSSLPLVSSDSAQEAETTSDLPHDLHQRLLTLSQSLEDAQDLSSQVILDYHALQIDLVSQGHDITDHVPARTLHLFQKLHTTYARLAPNIKALRNSAWQLELDTLVECFGLAIVTSRRMFEELVWFAKKGTGAARDQVGHVEKDQALSAIRTELDRRVNAERVVLGTESQDSLQPKDVRKAMITFNIAPKPFRKPKLNKTKSLKKTATPITPQITPDRGQSAESAPESDSEVDDLKSLQDDGSPDVESPQLHNVTTRKRKREPDAAEKVVTAKPPPVKKPSRRYSPDLSTVIETTELDSDVPSLDDPFGGTPEMSTDMSIEAGRNGSHSPLAEFSPAPVYDDNYAGDDVFDSDSDAADEESQPLGDIELPDESSAFLNFVQLQSDALSHRLHIPSSQSPANGPVREASDLDVIEGTSTPTRKPQPTLKPQPRPKPNIKTPRKSLSAPNTLSAAHILPPLHLQPPQSSTVPIADMSTTSNVRHDVSRFNPGNWLNDDDIHGIISKLCLPYQKCVNFGKLEAHMDVSAWVAAAAKHHTTSQHSQVLAPFSYDDRHWVLYVIDSDSCVVELYDSLPGPTRIDPSRIATAMLDIGGFVSENAKEARNWVFVRKQMPRQTNGDDCGIFVILAALCIMSDTPIPSRFDSKLWRTILPSLLDVSPTMRHQVQSAVLNFDVDALRRASRLISVLTSKHLDTRLQAEALRQKLHNVEQSRTLFSDVATTQEDWATLDAMHKTRLSTIQAELSLHSKKETRSESAVAALRFLFNIVDARVLELRRQESRRRVDVAVSL